VEVLRSKQKAILMAAVSEKDAGPAISQFFDRNGVLHNGSPTRQQQGRWDYVQSDNSFLLTKPKTIFERLFRRPPSYGVVFSSDSQAGFSATVNIRGGKQQRLEHLTVLDFRHQSLVMGSEESNSLNIVEFIPDIRKIKTGPPHPIRFPMAA
jgi:hypothetical protein